MYLQRKELFLHDGSVITGDISEPSPIIVLPMQPASTNSNPCQYHKITIRHCLKRTNRHENETKTWKRDPFDLRGSPVGRGGVVVVVSGVVIGIASVVVEMVVEIKQTGQPTLESLLLRTKPRWHFYCEPSF